MNDAFIRRRITDLRLKKGVSEYRMSTDIGHSKSYIQSITSGRAMPSMSEFLYICEYFGITPLDFFDAESKNPALLQQVSEALKNLEEKDLILIFDFIKRLQK